MNKRSLTARYTVHQVTYWASAAGVVSFATAFLLGKGFAPAMVGTLLAVGNLLSCAAQPLLANFADRVGGNVLKWMTAALTGVCVLCFGCVQLLPLPTALFGAVYLLGVFAFDVMNPLMNAVNVAYSENGYRINYGLSRGLGSFGYSVAALVIGELMARRGLDWMIWVSLALLVGNVLVVLGYPTLHTLVRQQEEEAAEECCTVWQFFGKYRWYCFSLVGVMLLAIFHAMTENYLIEVVTPLGGDSGSVGVALFIATFVEMVVLLFFEGVRKHMKDTLLLKIAGLSFLLKAVLLLFAPSVTAIYLIQLLQATSYTFLSPTQMYYASSRIAMADMVKGQAFITASYTLGCAAGNFAGGQLLQHFSVPVMLLGGVLMAALGTAVLYLTVEHKDVKTGENA